MRWWQSHVSDADLLLSEDGELGAGRQARVRRHLRDCPACADRREALVAGLARLTRTQREAQPPERDAYAARVRLQAQLARESEAAGALPQRHPLEMTPVDPVPGETCSV